MTLQDETLLFEHRLDGFALTVASRMAVQLTALLAEVEAILRQTGQAPLTRRELAAVQALLASRSGIADSLVVQLTALQSTAAGLAPRALARGLRSQGIRTTASQVAQAVAQSRQAAFAVTLGGQSPAHYARTLFRDLSVQLTARLAQSVALGESGFAFLSRTRSLADKVRAETENLTRSTATATANAVKMQVLEKLSPGGVYAWEYVAVLDNRTSRMCAGLSGSVWLASRKADLDRIKPPRHPNCRSSLLPLTREQYETKRAKVEREAGLDIDALNKAVDEGRTLASDRTAQDTAQALRALGRGAPGDFKLLPDFRIAGYSDWLEKQPESVQREILGPSRFAAWRRGVPLSRLGTFSRPLTLEELRRLYPDEFTGAAAA